MFQWRRMQVYETMGYPYYLFLKEAEGSSFGPISIADGCLDSQVEDCWLFS